MTHDCQNTKPCGLSNGADMFDSAYCWDCYDKEFNK